MPNTKAFVVRLVAKPGQEEQVAKLLVGALPHMQAETTTPVWFSFRAPDNTFYIVDAFADDGARQRHLEGPVAASLMQHIDLLAQPPEIIPVDVLAEKVTA